jgi:tetratricopeptide (TPR) repeat protein
VLNYNQEEIQNFVDDCLEKALVHYTNGGLLQAEAIVTQALKVIPEYYRALILLGIIYQKANPRKAIEVFEKILDKNPNSIESLNNLSLAYSDIGKLDESIKCSLKAIELNPNIGFLYANLSLQYRIKREQDKAIECLKKAISLEETAPAWGMLGCAYGEIKNYEEAERCLLKAVEVDPNFCGVHYDLASIYQLKGEWEKAWPEYEWRKKTFDQIKFWATIFEPEKEWTGKENLKDKRILIHFEQGVGDGIHFFRYVKLVKELGPYIIIHCDESMKPLILPHVDEVYTTDPRKLIPYHLRKNSDVPYYDYHCSMLSLPFLFNSPPIPATPYLHTSKRFDLTDYKDYFKIGIVWAGNPEHPNDKWRSCYLRDFSAVHDIPGVKLFSLQKNTSCRQYRNSTEVIDFTEGSENLKIVDLSNQINTFEDTAAAIKSLDLIITVDTSVAHLAGALGHPVWTLITYNPDWRWRANGNTTEWYSSMRLFRQEILGDWKSVLENIALEIKKREE